jgi:predicted AAA+ superfamily ATPase
VDEKNFKSQFVLTGSHQLLLMEKVTQSLAGRTILGKLLPFSLSELRKGPGQKSLKNIYSFLFTGGYPRIYDKGLNPRQWLEQYFQTYVERDVRSLLNIEQLDLFDRFVRLCAGRTAALLNVSTLGSDAGVSHNTARSWLSVLETSFLVFRLHPWQRKIKKQLSRAPKLHFFDSGLACYLLGITTPEQLRHHPLRGAIFETWVASEVFKARCNLGLDPRLFFFRDRKGLEVDLLVERAHDLVLVEAKSGATLASDFFSPLERVARLIQGTRSVEALRSMLVYRGDHAPDLGDVQVCSWREIAEQHWL